MSVRRAVCDESCSHGSESAWGKQPTPVGDAPSFDSIRYHFSTLIGAHRGPRRYARLAVLSTHAAPRAVLLPKGGGFANLGREATMSASMRDRAFSGFRPWKPIMRSLG
jgi:hypothetical protein